MQQPPAGPDQPSPALEPAPSPVAPAVRASGRERDAAVRRLRDAFAEGRRRGRWRAPERFNAVASKGVVETRPTPTPRGEITRG